MAGDDVHECRFTGTIWPDHPERLTRLLVNIDIAQRDNPAEAHGDEFGVEQSHRAGAVF